MKKRSLLIIGVLVISILLVAITPVFAESETSTLATNYSKDIDIKAITTGSDAYSVDVEWGDMTFKYSVGGWDTTNHEYGGVSENWTENTPASGDVGTEGYTLGSGDVLVRNHSNRAVTTAYTVANVESASRTSGFEAVTASISSVGASIEGCPVLGATGIAGVPYQTAKVTLAGAPTKEGTNVKIGTLTINISK